MRKKQVVEGRCPRCYSKAALRCGKCKEVSYCSKEHQVQDWELGHKATCGLKLAAPAPSCRPCTAGGAPMVTDEDWAAVLRASACIPTAPALKAAQPPQAPPKDRSQVPVRGILNDGNFCYANTVLQCICRTPAIASVLAGGEPAASAPAEGRSGPGEGSARAGEGRRGILEGALEVEEGSFTASLQRATEQLTRPASAGPLDPGDILQWLPKVGEFTYGEQEDAHELLRAIVRVLDHEQLQACRHRHPAAQPDEATSLVQRTFGGWLQSQIQCIKCGQASCSYEPFQDLSLEISAATDTIEESLELFTSPERLDKNNLYSCEACGQRSRGVKQMSIDAAPPTLVLQLKRFQAGQYGGKIDKHVRFAPVLNLLPFLSAGAANEAAQYHLWGLIVHMNQYNMASYGHYIACIRHHSRWFLIDDARVMEIPEQEVLSLHAYLLFYSLLQDEGSGAASSSGAAAPAAREDARTSTAQGTQATGGPQLCIESNCGFYGSAKTDWRCSSCYEKHLEATGQPRPANRPTSPPAPAEDAPSGSTSTDEAGNGTSGSHTQERRTKGVNGNSAGAGATPAAAMKELAVSDDAKSDNKVAPEKGGIPPKLGPNSKCPCGSGRKFKVCHGKK